MSYILDALRKLEQNRQHEESLTFLAFRGQPPGKPRRRRLWPYLFAAVLIVNAGAILWWIWPWQSAGSGVSVQPTAVRATRPAPSAPGPGVQGVQIRAADEQKSPLPEVAKTPQQTAGEGTIATARSAVRQAPSPPQAPLAERVSAATAAPRLPDEPSSAAVPPSQAGVSPPADGRVLKRADLPASVAGALPEFKISLHYYVAEPQSRVVWINDRTLREGQYLSEGLKVEQINEGDVVMDYRGWRFQLELNRNP